MMYLMMYGEHNIHFLVFAALMDGDFETALENVTELESRARSGLSEFPPLEAFLPMRTFLLLRFARWEEVLALPRPDANLKGLTFFWHYARGCAFAAKGEAFKADSERNAMEASFNVLPAGLAFGMQYNNWSTIHDLALDTLTARIRAAQGDRKGAIQKWQAAVAVEDQMRYDEPPDWFYPVRESLGAALLANDRPAEAEQVFREDLRKNPRNPRSLYGLWKALDAQMKTIDSKWVEASFTAAWKGPEPPHLADF